MQLQYSCRRSRGHRRARGRDLGARTSLLSSRGAQTAQLSISPIELAADAHRVKQPHVRVSSTTTAFSNRPQSRRTHLCRSRAPSTLPQLLQTTEPPSAALRRRQHDAHENASPRTAQRLPSRRLCTLRKEHSPCDSARLPSASALHPEPEEIDFAAIRTASVGMRPL